MLSIKQKFQQKKISPIWKHFIDTDDYFVRQCKHCGGYLPFCNNSHLDYLKDYLLQRSSNKECKDQYDKLMEWGEQSNHEWKVPGKQTRYRCNTVYLERHLQQNHPMEYQRYLQSRNKRCSYNYPLETIENSVGKICETMRYHLMTNVAIENLVNVEGQLFLHGLFSRDMYYQILNVTYDTLIKQIQDQTSQSVPMTILIDEWKSPYYNYKLLGISANYLTSDFQAKHKCLGLVKLASEDAVTIRRVTEGTVSHFFGNEFSFITCHDTASVMSCAFRVDLHIENNQQSFNQEIINVDEDEQMEIESDEISALNSIPEDIIESITSRVAFKNIENVNIHHERCHVHVFDLFVKKAIESSQRISNELQMANKIVIKLQTNKVWKQWHEFCGERGIKCIKFPQISTTRFYTYYDLLEVFRAYSDEIKVFYEKNHYNVYEFDDMRRSVNSNEPTFKMPDLFEESVKVLKEIKNAQLILGSDNQETLPHVISSIIKIANTIISGLNEYNIEVKVKDFVPICEIIDKEMKFEIKKPGVNKRNCSKCSIKVVNHQYIIKQSGTISENGIETDCLFLLLLMYFVSSKYRHILVDNRLLIANCLNPHMKNLIPPEYFQQHLLCELYHIDIECYFTPEEELMNYLLIKMESGLTYDQYWNFMKNTFKRLYFLSLKYRSFSASEIAIERLFSICQLIHNSRRNSLSLDRFSKLACLQYNLKKSNELERSDFFKALFNELMFVLKNKYKLKK